MLNDLGGIGLVLGAFGALLGGLALLRRTGSSDPEIQRKTLHTGMGIVALMLPRLFAATWPVIVLTGAFISVLLVIRLFPPLRQKLGGVIYDVGRHSYGEIYFVLGVGGLFFIAHRHPLLYCVSILALVLADAAASLVGGRCGRLRYEILGDNKSVEGSAAFLSAVLLVGELGLLVFTSLGTIQSLLIALVLALAVTLVEAMACRGSDNLIVPLGTCVLLKGLLALNLPGLIVCFIIAAVVVPVAFLFLYWRSNPEVASRRLSPALSTIGVALGAVFGLAGTLVERSLL